MINSWVASTTSSTNFLKLDQVGAVVSCLALHLWGHRFKSHQGHYVDWGLQSLLDRLGFPWNNPLGFFSRIQNWNFFIIFSSRLALIRELWIFIQIQRRVFLSVEVFFYFFLFLIQQRTNKADKSQKKHFYQFFISWFLYNKERSIWSAEYSTSLWSTGPGGCPVSKLLSSSSEQLPLCLW